MRDPEKWRHDCDCGISVFGVNERDMNLRWAWHFIFCRQARRYTRRYWGHY